MAAATLLNRALLARVPLRLRKELLIEASHVEPPAYGRARVESLESLVIPFKRQPFSGRDAELPLTGILRWRARQRAKLGVKVGPKTARRRNLWELGKHVRLSGDGVGQPVANAGRVAEPS